jgi:NADPH:quinone reductase
MQAIVMREFGPPEVLVACEVPDPMPGPGEVVVDVSIVNITFVETQLRGGRPPNPAMAPRLPVIPGNGVGGVVGEVGAGVDRALAGTRVVTTTGGSGAYAERVAVDASRLIGVPDGLDMAEAVALLADGRTAMLLVRDVKLEAVDTVLVEAAGGGVGSLLVQLAHSAGATVVAAGGDDRKLTLAREIGAAVTVNYLETGWPERVRAEIGAGVDVAFDGVGGEIGLASFGLVRDGGRFVPFGMASGAFAAIPEAEAARRGVSVLRLSQPTADEARQLTHAALAEAEAGRLRPVIGQRFALAEAARAHAAIESRATLGKTLLIVEVPTLLGERP